MDGVQIMVVYELYYEHNHCVDSKEYITKHPFCSLRCQSERTKDASSILILGKIIPIWSRRLNDMGAPGKQGFDTIKIVL
uniref:Uncharacterized protein n=1 Tax=Onchocerca volvulus TaxID=6282 RepID=A0A8R1TM13_ONCVO